MKTESPIRKRASRTDEPNNVVLAYKFFENGSKFGDNCIFFNCDFGDDCSFGDNNEFASYTKSGNNCRFGNKPLFGEDCFMIHDNGAVEDLA